LRRRRTSSDSLPVVELKELSVRETVEGICNRVFNIHTQEINKGIIKFRHSHREPSEAFHLEE
jgi:hypothetical protein